MRGHVPAAEAPLLVVANHVSWLDTYALNTVSAARFVAKSEVRGWPVIGVDRARFGTHLPQTRLLPRRGAHGRRARRGARAAASRVAAFPEATTSEGRGLLPFYPAMFQAAVLSGARVQPVAMRYRDGDGRPTRPPRRSSATCRCSTRCACSSREPRLSVELVFCAPLDPHGRSRRELAARSRAAIADALGLAATDADPDSNPVGGRRSDGEDERQKTKGEPAEDAR